MWKKTESEYSPLPPATPSRDPIEQLRERAMIGPSIFLRGDITGDEDLVIQGRVEGKVELKQHNVTVGKSGRVKADILGKIISIEGEVEGNLLAEDKIIIRQSGKVRGNITAPRVNLEDGAKFKGSIDMDSKADKQRTLTEVASESKTQAEEKELRRTVGLDLKVDPRSSRA